MKKAIVFAGMVLLVASVALADSYTWSGGVGSGKSVTSGVVTASGWLDKVDISQTTAGSTCSIWVATWDGTTAVDTFVALTNNTSSTVVVRPRFMGTSNGGTAFTAAWQGGDTNLSAATTTILVGSYERPMIGGNTKILLTGACATTDVQVTIFYEPLRK